MRKNVLYIIALLIIVFWLSMLSFNQPKVEANRIVEEVTVTGISTDITKQIAKHRNEAVSVVTENSLQSGFIYKQNEDRAYILTCYHGISSASQIEVQFGETYREEAIIVGYDFYTDLAVLLVHTPYELSVCKPGDASLLKSGEFVLSIGSPTSIDYAGSFELGIISLPHMMLDNSISYRDNYYNYYLDMISFSSNIKAGYSGSPLYNLDGQVVGISTMANTNTRYALTINEAKIIADTIINLETLNRNDFGISVAYVKDLYTYEKSNLGLTIDTVSGIYIKDIKDNSMFAKAGIRKGDIILKINDIELNDFDSYLSAMYLDATELTVSYLRDGSTNVTVIGLNHD